MRSAHAKRAGPPPRGRTAEPAMTPTTTVRVVSVAALRLALDEWRLAAAGAAPPLADESALEAALDAVDARAAARGKKTARKPATKKRVQKRLAAPKAEDDASYDDGGPGEGEDLCLGDVLAFARRVADDDAAAVSASRLDDAVRRSRRSAVTAARLREGAADLEQLRYELRSRGVELDAWLRAAKESEIPNFKGSYLGRFPLVLADFGRAIISRNGLEAWMLYSERARAEHSR